MNKKAKQSHVGTELPQDIWKSILSHCQLRDLLQISLVSKSLRSLVHTASNAWKQLISIDFNLNDKSIESELSVVDTDENKPCTEYRLYQNLHQRYPIKIEINLLSSSTVNLKDQILISISTNNRSNKAISLNNGLKQGRKKVNYLKNGAYFKSKSDEDNQINDPSRESIYRQRFSQKLMLDLAEKQSETIECKGVLKPNGLFFSGANMNFTLPLKAGKNYIWVEMPDSPATKSNVIELYANM